MMFFRLVEFSSLVAGRQLGNATISGISFTMRPNDPDSDLLGQGRKECRFCFGWFVLLEFLTRPEEKTNVDPSRTTCEWLIFFVTDGPRVF